jgi:hypothetical protein
MFKKKGKNKLIVLTRKLLRNIFRKKVGNKNLKIAWQRYQDNDNRGRRKLIIKKKGEK